MNIRHFCKNVIEKEDNLMDLKDKLGYKRSTYNVIYWKRWERK